MKTSVIRQRVADFLKRQAPFDALSETDLLDLSGSGRVKFHESEEYIFRQGDARGQVVWIIQQGRVELLEEEQLRDVLGEGDMVGLEHLGPDGTSLHSARTATDVILYGISAALFEAMAPRYPAVQRFVAAHFSVAGILGFGRTSWLDAEAPPADFLRARFAGRGTNGDPTIALPVTTRAAVRAMLEAGVEELTVTANGVPESTLSADELALFCGYNPARLASAIRQAGSAAELNPLLWLTEKLVRAGMAQPHDIDDCCRIAAYVMASVTDACVRLAHRDVEAYGIGGTELPSCWLLFGSAARGDQLELRLPAIAAVYDDAAEGCGVADSVHFTTLAGETAAWLHRCELAGASWQWPEGSQPSMPLSEWQRFYRETIRNPMAYDLYARREFFDVWPRSGDAAILRALEECITAELREHPMTISLLANDTLAHLPPLTFFQGLVVGLDGGSRDRFDIREAAISPVTDAARVFALAKGRLAPANTPARLQAAALDFPESAKIFQEAAEAFRIALYYRTLENSSQIDPGMLGKFDQRLLKTAFSSVQRLLEFTAATFVAGT